MNELKTRGCVYFFKHTGLNPVKIGYSNVKDIDSKNNFQIRYAKSLQYKKKYPFSSVELPISNKTFEYFKEIYLLELNFNRTIAAYDFNVSRKTIYKWIKKLQNL